jgi:hypothetical protein
MMRKSRRMSWAGHVACTEQARKVVRTPEGKRSLFGRPRLMWEDNIKTDLWEIGLEGVDGINPVQCRYQC